MRSLITAFTALVVVGSLTPSAASAQTEPPFAPRWVAGGHAGAGKTWDDEGGLGSGVSGGARGGVALGAHHLIEAGVWAANHRREGVFIADGRTILGEVTYTHLFRESGVRPFVLGGAVLAHHDGTTGFTIDGSRFRTQSTDPGMTGGAGVLFPVHGGLAIGPEVRLTWLQPSRNSAPVSILTAGVRVGFNLPGSRSAIAERQ